VHANSADKGFMVHQNADQALQMNHFKKYLSLGSLVLFGAVTIAAHDITSHGLLSMKISSTCDESFSGFTLRRPVKTGCPIVQISMCRNFDVSKPLSDYSMKPDQTCSSQAVLGSQQTRQVRWLWASWLRHSRASKWLTCKFVKFVNLY
jgi:hypothetical protein